MRKGDTQVGEGRGVFFKTCSEKGRDEAEGVGAAGIFGEPPRARFRFARGVARLFGRGILAAVIVLQFEFTSSGCEIGGRVRKPHPSWLWIGSWEAWC